MAFNSLNLDQRILKSITESGYTTPTLIQLEAIPKVLEGVDMRASAQTGTGKTAAFLLPALQRLISTEPKKGKGPRLLVLVPTRELGMQIADQAHKYSKHLPKMKTVSISGGVPYSKQLPKLSAPYEILIATPGRLIDLMNQKKVSFQRLEMLVLDEADRMLDMGFIAPVEEIVRATPKEKQTLLFSATLEGEIHKLSKRILKDPIDIVIHSRNEKHENIDQKLHYVDNIAHKNALLDHILSDNALYNAIVFTATKRHADQLRLELSKKGHEVGALHGDMNQRQRTQIIKRLRDGRIRILVATDVAARGIDIDSITHVINFDLPHNPEDYVHRIGRTGRAGAQGTALSFASDKDTSIVRRIEQFTKHPFEVAVIPGFEPKPKKKGAPAKKRPFKKTFSQKKKRVFKRTR